jgi:hypothetical protein
LTIGFGHGATPEQAGLLFARRVRRIRHIELRTAPGESLHAGRSLHCKPGPEQIVTNLTCFWRLVNR